ALPAGFVDVALAESLTDFPLIFVPFTIVVAALVRLNEPRDVVPPAAHVPLALYKSAVIVAAMGETDVAAWTVLLASVNVACAGFREVWPVAVSVNRTPMWVESITKY